MFLLESVKNIADRCSIRRRYTKLSATHDLPKPGKKTNRHHFALIIWESQAPSRRPGYPGRIEVPPVRPVSSTPVIVSRPARAC